jgi:hypothetical protein
MNESGRRIPLALGVALGLLLVASLVWIVTERSDGSARSPVGSARSSAAATSRDDVVISASLVSATASEAKGRFDFAWTSPSFPGFHECTWRAIGADGSLLGSYSDLVAALSPTQDLPVSISTHDRATRLDASCGPRLDIGEPYAYDFSNITVAPSTLSSADPGTVVVTFDVTWAGPATPGAVSCTISYFDSTGKLLDDHDTFTFMAMTGSVTGGEHSYASLVFTSTTPASASYSCTPFTGAAS